MRKFAWETASLDHLSGGRLVVGAGEGQEQFGDLGDEPDQRVRGEMLDDGLAVMAGEPHSGPDVSAFTRWR